MVCAACTGKIGSLLLYTAHFELWQSDTYEELWPLIIPPVMALLDDYEARYKLQGVQIVSVMLQQVPKELLKRTGVDGLIRSVRESIRVPRRSTNHTPLLSVVSQHMLNPHPKSGIWGSYSGCDRRFTIADIAHNNSWFF